MIVGVSTSVVQGATIAVGKPANDNGYGLRYGMSYGKA